MSIGEVKKLKALDFQFHFLSYEHTVAVFRSSQVNLFNYSTFLGFPFITIKVLLEAFIMMLIIFVFDNPGCVSFSYIKGRTQITGI